MKKIIFTTLLITLLSNSALAKEESMLSNINSIVSNQSCFAGERSNYEGFIKYSLKEIKRSFGRKVSRLTVDILKRRLSQSRFEDLRNSYDCQLFTYKVDNISVGGFYLNSKAKNTQKISPLKPLMIFNRGGNGDFGRITLLTMLRNTPIVDAGYVVMASQYRQEDEFGGKDLNDVLDLVTIGKSLPIVNSSSVHMMGVSRGGMMTYMAARKLKTLKSIIVWAGPTNLEGLLPLRPEMERVYQARIPNYKNQKSTELSKRSVINWSKELDPNLPILILHGDADKAVDVTHATTFAKQLEKNNQPHKLVVYENDDHGLRKNNKQAYNEIIQWMNNNQ